MSVRTATFTGLGAIALWSSLAVLTSLAAPPPFLGCAVAFAIAAALGLAKRVVRREPLFAA